MSSRFRVLAVFSIFLSLAHAQIPKPASLLDMTEFVQDWKISKQFTLDVANAMPAELYTFRPNPDEMSFGEQIVHIAGANAFRFAEISSVKAPFEFQPGKMPTDKESAVRMLEQSFEYVIQVLPGLAPEQLKRTWQIPSWKGRPEPDGRAMILNMFVHTAHHRAQCEVYLRVKGIKPPDYMF
jgi:uncharacterized damage-inducible protein DinB